MPGDKLKMVKNKQGDTVPFYAADGVGKMMRGGKVEMMRGGKVEMMRGGKVEMMRGGKVEMMRGGKINGYKHGGCVIKKTNQNPHMS